MIKKLLIALLVCIIPMAVFSGCNLINPNEPDNKTTTCTITFVQEGKDNIVRTVEKGATLTDIPTPVPSDHAGYDIVWDKTDFSNIQNDFTVTAVKSAKSFTITYVVSENAKTNGVTLSTTTQTVKYGEQFTLLAMPTYVSGGTTYILTAWLYNGNAFVSGTWSLTENVTLTMDHFEPVSFPEWI